MKKKDQGLCCDFDYVVTTSFRECLNLYHRKDLEIITLCSIHCSIALLYVTPPSKMFTPINAANYTPTNDQGRTYIPSL